MLIYYLMTDECRTSAFLPSSFLAPLTSSPTILLSAQVSIESNQTLFKNEFIDQQNNGIRPQQNSEFASRRERHGA